MKLPSFMPNQLNRPHCTSLLTTLISAFKIHTLPTKIVSTQKSTWLIAGSYMDLILQLTCALL